MRACTKAIALILMMFLMTTISTSQTLVQKGSGDPELAKKIRRFSPTVLTANTTHLSAGDRQALIKIIAAAKLLDPLFLRQVWSGNEALKNKLEADKTEAGRQRLHYFLNQRWTVVAHRQQRAFHRRCASRKAASTLITIPTT